MVDGNEVRAYVFSSQITTPDGNKLFLIGYLDKCFWKLVSTVSVAWWCHLRNLSGTSPPRQRILTIKHPFFPENSIYAAFWHGNSDVVSLPSVFARLDSLLASHTKPHSMVRVEALRRGARGKRVALGETIWVSHLQQGYGCDSFVLAACSERLRTTGPWWRGRGTSQMT